jgi:hypothetical protein
MPTTYNAIGTHFWGCTDPRPDGSFTTTEWITLGIPIVPIKSVRILPGKLSDFIPSGSGLKREQQFEIIERLPSLCIKQILHVYKGVLAFLIAFTIALILLIKIAFVHNNFIGVIIFLAILFISYFIFTRWVNRFAK